MKKIILVLLCVLSIPALASHIVGGEFEIVYVGQYPGDFRYKVNLIMYFDEKNGIQSNKTQDAIIYARVYRVSDNAVMIDRLPIPFVNQTNVNYTQPQCSIEEVKTSRQFYSTTITLPGSEYNDPKGYYIVWERCCRNYSIVNIYSNDPGAPGSITAGQTFYLKFPPVVKNGVPFINSSPNIFPPLSDYACPNKPYYANFAGTDKDGDSIAYSITTPFNTNAGVSYPDILPQPYPYVTWRNPFSFNSIMGGHPDLRISKNGFLTVTPGFITGLYVFAVKCEEFRNGEKIGETRRDFQLFVSPSCPEAEPPQIIGKKLYASTYSNLNETLNVNFPISVSDGDRCIEVQVYDPDALKATQNFTEKITIKAIPLNFKGDISDILPGVTTAVLIEHDSVKTFRICFKDCPYIEGPFLIGIVAYDDACALPLTDTLKVNVNITTPVNNNAYFVTSNVKETVGENTVKTWPIHGVDIDHDALVATIVPTNGFDMSKFGISVVVQSNNNGDYVAELKWDTDCSKYDFTHQTEFIGKIFLEDADHCDFKHPAVMIFNLKLDDHDSPPVISSSLATKTNHRRDSVTFRILEKPALTFNVTGMDADSYPIVLSDYGKDFKLSDYDIKFAGGQGVNNISSQFQWNINCDNMKLDVKNIFNIRFIVVDDKNKCHIYKADTLDVNVTVKPPVNTAPKLKVSSLDPALPLVDNSLSIVIGQQITLGLNGTDADRSPSDFLKMELIEATGNAIPEGYTFQPRNGYENAEGTFTWFPDCSAFKGNVFENNYNFSFRVMDDRCLNVKGDTVKVNLIVKDIDYGDKEFLPPNFITPNGDGFNEYFAMEGIDSIDPERVTDPNEEIALPKDNCSMRFESIRIYNRWGKEVFNSHQRNFRWYAQDAVVGVYFYSLKYTNKEYKGSISVRE